MVDSTAGDASVPSQQLPEVVVRGLRKHWLLGSLVALGILGGAVFFTVGAKRIFRATATVQIDPNPPKPLGNQVEGVVDMGAGTYWTNKEYFVTQQKLLGSRAVAEETVRTLGLLRDQSFLQNLPEGGVPRPSRREPHPTDAVDALTARLKIEPIRDSRLVVVNYEDANPERARKILSTLVDIYLNRNIDQVVASTGAASEWLRQQVDNLKGELEKNELALHEYKKERRLLSLSLDDQSSMLREEMRQLNEALTRVRADKEELDARVKAMQGIDPEDPAVIPASELLGNNLLSSMRQSYIAKKSALGSLLGSGKGENHPDVLALRAEVEAAKEGVLAEITNLRSAYQNDLGVMTREQRGLERLFGQAEQRALDLNMLEIEYARLARAKDNTEKLFGLVLERSKQSDLTGMMRFNNISIAEKPVTLERPVSPKSSLNLALGLLFGLGFGVLSAIGREMMDRTVRSPEEIEAEMGLSLLGIIPSLTGKAKKHHYYSAYPSRDTKRPSLRPPGRDLGQTPPELIAHAMPDSSAAECARSIRTSLTFSSPDKPFRKILVTSGSPSEGKTTVAATLAIVFAQAGHRTVLVDCDLRRSRLHRVFKKSNAAGVTSVLAEPDTLAAALGETQVPDLMLLAAGPAAPNPAELLESESMKRLLARLEERFDRIVIDSPPALVVTDSTILSTRVDTTVLVLRAKKTRRDSVKKLARVFQSLGSHLSGVVLNAMQADKGKRGYYYYGGVENGES